MRVVRRIEYEGTPEEIRRVLIHSLKDGVAKHLPPHPQIKVTTILIEKDKYLYLHGMDGPWFKVRRVPY